jgi:membrane-bound serine protease (ClpP class)
MPEIHLVTPITIVGFAVVGAIVLLLVAAKFLPETNLMAGIGLTLPTELRTVEGYSSHDTVRISTLMGSLGVALSPLKPSGIAQIGGERVNVVTEGDFIDTGQKVRVVAVEGMRVLVQPEEPNA